MDKANKMDSKHLPLRFKAQKHRIQLNVTVSSVIELKNFLTSGKCKSGPENTRFPLFKELPCHKIIYIIQKKVAENFITKIVLGGQQFE